MNEQEFKYQLSHLTQPADILKWAPEIYAYLSGLFRENCSDSVLREWAFQWAADKMGVDYDVLYKAWLK
jgi:hypothetical protein